LGKKLIARFKGSYTSAMECLGEDLEECLTYLKFPERGTGRLSEPPTCWSGCFVKADGEPTPISEWENLFQSDSDWSKLSPRRLGKNEGEKAASGCDGNRGIRRDDDGVGGDLAVDHVGAQVWASGIRRQSVTGEGIVQGTAVGTDAGMLLIDERYGR
jgi:hypothetical protein